MSIIYISIDCARKDSFGCLAEPDSFIEPYTPNIDKIARDGSCYNNVITAAPYTPASHATFLTGKMPFQHGIRRMYGDKLHSTVTTHAMRFRDMGFETAAFVGYEGLLSQCGLGKGFEYFDESSDLSSAFGASQLGAKGNDWRSNFCNWYDDHSDDQAFLFFHYFHSHAGSEDVIPTKYNSYGRKGKTGKPYIDKYYDTYEGKIAWFDQEWLPLIVDRYPPERNRYIIAGDHGECLDDSYEVGHRRHLLDDTIRIPLVCSNPSGVGSCSHMSSSSIFGIFSGIHGAYHPGLPFYLDRYLYTETFHEKIPGYRLGLKDVHTNKTYVWTANENLENIEPDICYSEPTQEAQSVIDTNINAFRYESGYIDRRTF